MEPLSVEDEQGQGAPSPPAGEKPERPDGYYTSSRYDFFVQVTLKKTEVTVDLSKTLMAMASGVLVFTGTFAEGSRGTLLSSLALGWCWALMLLSIAASAIRLLLVDEFMSRFADRRHAQAREDEHSEEEHSDYKSPIRGWASTTAKHLSVWLFVAGLIAFGAYAARG